MLYDALLAGDVDHTAFEEGLSAETLVRWVPLGDMWAFWRGGKLTKQSIHKALSTAYELFLFDARWFLETVSAKGGTLKGTEVLADGLAKDDLTQWVRRIHETGDGSPKGIVAALGWDKIVAKTPNDVLVAALDAVAIKVGLVAAAAKDSQKVLDAGAKPEAKAEPAPSAAEPPPAAAAKATPAASSAAKPAVAGTDPAKPATDPASPAKAETTPGETGAVDKAASDKAAADKAMAEKAAAEKTTADKAAADRAAADKAAGDKAAAGTSVKMPVAVVGTQEEPSWSEPPPPASDEVVAVSAETT